MNETDVTVEYLTVSARVRLRAPALLTGSAGWDDAVAEELSRCRWDVDAVLRKADDPERFAEEHGMSLSGERPAATCTVCLDELGDDGGVELTCTHVMHSECAKMRAEDSAVKIRNVRVGADVLDPSRWPPRCCAAACRGFVQTGAACSVMFERDTDRSAFQDDVLRMRALHGPFVRCRRSDLGCRFLLRVSNDESAVACPCGARTCANLGGPFMCCGRPHGSVPCDQASRLDRLLASALPNIDAELGSFPRRREVIVDEAARDAARETAEEMIAEAAGSPETVFTEEMLHQTCLHDISHLASIEAEPRVWTSIPAPGPERGAHAQFVRDFTSACLTPPPGILVTFSRKRGFVPYRHALRVARGLVTPLADISAARLSAAVEQWTRRAHEADAEAARTSEVAADALWRARSALTKRRVCAAANDARRAARDCEAASEIAARASRVAAALLGDAEAEPGERLGPTASCFAEEAERIAESFAEDGSVDSAAAAVEDRLEETRLKLDTARTVRPCPACFTPVQKSASCNAMQCTACMNKFCWSCLGPQHDHTTRAWCERANEEMLQRILEAARHRGGGNAWRDIDVSAEETVRAIRAGADDEDSELRADSESDDVPFRTKRDPPLPALTPIEAAMQPLVRALERAATSGTDEAALGAMVAHAVSAVAIGASRIVDAAATEARQRHPLNSSKRLAHAKEAQRHVTGLAWCDALAVAGELCRSEIRVRGDAGRSDDGAPDIVMAVARHRRREAQAARTALATRPVNTREGLSALFADLHATVSVAHGEVADALTLSLHAALCGSPAASNKRKRAPSEHARIIESSPLVALAELSSAVIRRMETTRGAMRIRMRAIGAERHAEAAEIERVEEEFGRVSGAIKAARRNAKDEDIGENMASTCRVIVKLTADIRAEIERFIRRFCPTDWQRRAARSEAPATIGPLPQ